MNLASLRFMHARRYGLACLFLAVTALGLAACQLIDVSFTISSASVKVGDSITLTPTVTVIDNKGSKGQIQTYDAGNASEKDVKKGQKELDRLEWDFGNGTTRTTYDEQPITVIYSAPGTYTIRLTAFDKKGSSESTSKIVEVAVRAAFADEFNGTNLGPQWTVTKIPNQFGPGNDVSYTEGNGVLQVSNPGGSNGSMGVGDGAEFIPDMAALNGDFTVSTKFTEVSRTSVGGQPTLTTFSLVFRSVKFDTTPQQYSRLAGLTVGGDNYPTGPGAYNGHTVEFSTWNGVSLLSDAELQLTPGVLNTIELEFSRIGLFCTAKFRVDGEANWRVFAQAACPSNPVFPYFQVGSGDGHTNTVNAAAVVNVDYFRAFNN